MISIFAVKNAVRRSAVSSRQDTAAQSYTHADYYSYCNPVQTKISERLHNDPRDESRDFQLVTWSARCGCTHPYLGQNSITRKITKNRIRAIQMQIWNTQEPLTNDKDL